MAIARTQNGNAAATSATLTSCTAGDIIVVFAYDSAGTTIPTLPAGFTDIVNTAGTQQAARLGYKRAVGGETSTGTWTNATNVCWLVYSGCLASGSPFGTTPILTAGNSTTPSFAAVTLVVTDGSSIFLGFVGHKVSNTGQTPTGGSGTVLTPRGISAGLAYPYDSPASATNYVSQIITVGVSGRWQSATLELKAFVAGPSQQQKSAFFPFL